MNKIKVPYLVFAIFTILTVASVSRAEDTNGVDAEKVVEAVDTGNLSSQARNNIKSVCEELYKSKEGKCNTLVCSAVNDDDGIKALVKEMKSCFKAINKAKKKNPVVTTEPAQTSSESKDSESVDQPESPEESNSENN